MGSRIFWIMLAGAALVAGIATQERNWLFAWGGDAADVGVERATERAIEARVERAVERGFDRMQVVDSDGRPIDVAPQTRQQLADAVRRLASAEADLALLRIRNGDEAAVQDARNRRDEARAQIERLKGEIERQNQLAEREQELVRDKIQQEIRESVRAAVRN